MVGAIEPSICIFFVGRRRDGGKWVFGSVMCKVDEERKKRMAEEDKHTLHKNESLHSIVKWEDLDFTCPREKRRKQCGQYCIFVWKRGVLQAYFTPTCLEVKGFGDWD